MNSIDALLENMKAMREMQEVLSRMVSLQVQRPDAKADDMVALIDKLVRQMAQLDSFSEQAEEALDAGFIEDDLADNLSEFYTVARDHCMSLYAKVSPRCKELGGNPNLAFSAALDKYGF
ncbi:hypothetical protein [Salipiger abyssi]|uniref:hypothetical protein n=1 Tax=Salipiger abyssi TaxID=1250539 RepID=UPI004059FD5C